MGYETRYKKASAAEDTPKDIPMKVEIVDEGILEEEVHDAPAEEKQDQALSDFENIIMEGDIILNVHADAEVEEPVREWQIEHRSGIGDYCKVHHDLFHFRDEKLVRPGDTFNSHKDFIQYISANAKRWCFYYKCTESYNVDTENESYVYNCVYLKNKDYKRKSIKKRYNSKTDCPCKIKLKRKPNEKLTVVYVCNHHDHELSEENFNKLVNNRKLPPYIKEVIMDLLSLEVEIPKIRKFVEVETSIKMSRAFFYDIERKMKIYNEDRQISALRLKELSDKIAVIDDLYNCEDDGENTDDQGVSIKKRQKGLKASQAKKRKKAENMIEISLRGVSESENTSSIKERITYEQDGDWIIEQSGREKHRNNSANWDISSIPNHDESQLKADTDDDTQEYTEQEQDETYQTEAIETTEYVQETTEDAQPTNQEQAESENQFQYQTVVLQDEFGNVINCGNDEQIVIIQDENGLAQTADGETIGYFDGEKIIYMDEANMEQNQEANPNNEANDDTADNTCHTEVGVHTNTKPGHSYVPVFDVYMKDGNVTGFIVNDKVKGGIEKGVQTPEDAVQNETQVSKLSDMMDETVEIPATNGTQEIVTGDIYTKHEYIHRYNIDHYMTKPNFPKYIETLAKKTRVEVLHMLTKVYNEKAMFKMTTTQRGKEGNTKIWYLTDVRRKGQYKMSDEEKRKRDKIGQYLTDILILKETVKSLKKENGELISRNKYLEEVALRLANMRNN